MTADEITIVRALRNVTFLPGSRAKSLVRDLNAVAERQPDHELTPRQREAVLSIAARFRRQVPADVVDLAKRLTEESSAEADRGEAFGRATS